MTQRLQAIGYWFTADPNRLRIIIFAVTLTLTILALTSVLPHHGLLLITGDPGGGSGGTGGI